VAVEGVEAAPELALAPEASAVTGAACAVPVELWVEDDGASAAAPNVTGERKLIPEWAMVKIPAVIAATAANWTSFSELTLMFISSVLGWYSGGSLCHP
jgi:hypothetical protein